METVRTFSIGAVVVAALSLYSQITTRTLHRNLKRALFLVFTLHFSVLAYCQTYPYVRHDVLPKNHVYLREDPRYGSACNGYGRFRACKYPVYD